MSLMQGGLDIVTPYPLPVKWVALSQGNGPVCCHSELLLLLTLTPERSDVPSLALHVYPGDMQELFGNPAMTSGRRVINGLVVVIS